MTKKTSYVEQQFDPADRERHDLTFTTSMPGSDGLARCQGTNVDGSGCDHPIVVEYQHLREVWAGRITLCPYHQDVEDHMLARRVA